jgi:hypothetical protein
MMASGFHGTKVPLLAAAGQGKNLLALIGAKEYYW